MKVYHLLNEEYGLKDLREKRLKISTILELNDPFEFLPISLSDKDDRRSIGIARKIMDKHLGLICFSRTWDNPVLWSHYADKHKGFALGFEVLEKDVREVTYVKKRLKASDVGKKVKTLLTHKYSDWEYENEVRMQIGHPS